MQDQSNNPHFNVSKSCSTEFGVNWLIQNMHMYVGEGSSRRNVHCKEMKGGKIYDALFWEGQ